MNWQALACVVALSGCATSGIVTGGDPTTQNGGQAETAATTTFHRNVHRIVVAYNDETGSQAVIQYGPSSRKVLRGASLMGWSYSEDHGATWKYGGKVTSPPGWAVLWGDPAITTSNANYGMAFMSSLAFPDAKFPKEGVDGGVDGRVAGGACIARSVNGGVHFQHFQCVANTEAVPGRPSASKGHFYDGGAMASSARGEIYAAYTDIDTSQVDIWRSPDGHAPFARLPAPFANYYVGSHPRIRVGPDDTLFVMAVVKQSVDGGFLLAANRYRNGQWGAPTFITPAQLYPDIDLGSAALGAPLTVRTGPQFSFDVGASSADRDDSIRFLVTQKNGQGWLFIRGGICDYGLKSCGWYEGWTFGASSVRPNDRQRLDVFNPNVDAFPGFLFGVAPRWQGTFLTRFGNNTTTLNLTRGTLGYIDDAGVPKPFTIPVDIARDVPVCSDLRGYWGDYDGFLHIQVETDRVRFMRFMTDSSRGCVRRWQFIGEPQHIRAVDYWY